MGECGDVDGGESVRGGGIGVNDGCAVVWELNAEMFKTGDEMVKVDLWKDRGKGDEIRRGGKGEEEEIECERGGVGVERDGV